MKSIKSTKLCSWLIERKLMLFIIAVSFVAMVLPGAFVCATELVTDEASQPALPAVEEQATPAAETEVIDEGVVVVTGEEEATTEEAVPATEVEASDEGVVIVTGDDSENATVTGTLTDSMGNAISEDKDPYVMIAWISLLGADQKRIYLKDGATNFSISDVPSTILKGVITAGAKGYANEIFILPDSDLSKPKDFKLYAGSECTFVNEEEKLGEYKLCAGSSIKTREGHSFTLDIDYGIGAGLPVFGIPVGGVFTETVDPYTYEYSLTYNYEDPATEEKLHLIFEVTPESGYQFNYVTINDEIIPSEGYEVTTTDGITIKPIFTERGKMIVGGIVKDKATGEVIEGAYGYIIGFDILTGEMYYSKMQYTDDEGIFTFTDVPDGLKGVIVGGAPGHTTQPQYLSYYVPRTEFDLNPGVVCTIEPPEELSTVMIEAGSKIKIDGFDELTLPFAVDLGNDFPPLGFPNDGEMDFKGKGVVEYKFTHDDPDHSVKSLDLILKAYPKSDFAFKNWLLDGKEFSGKLQLSTVEDDFTIKPVFKAATPYTFSTYIQNEARERITNAYAYLVGIHESTGGMYLTSPVQTDSQGVFAIEDIPYDVSGLVVVGAPGYVNRFEFIDCDTEATFFTLAEGVQISFDMPKTASTVLIEKGSSVSVIVEGIPLTFALPENIDFGSMFLPFGITPHGTFKFLDDGKLNYNFTRQDSNRVDIQELNITFDVLPNEGYVFKDWLKNGEVVTGTEYTLQAGDTDFVLTPVFELVNPPQPTPVDPTVDPTSPMAKTFDSIGDVFEAFAILTLAFALVYAYKTLRRRKHN